MLGKTIYLTLLGAIIKGGKRRTAEALVTRSLNRVSKSLKIPTYKIYRLLAKKLGSLVELKTVKIRRNTYKVPFPLKKSRRKFILARELLVGVEKNKQKIAYSKKLSQEIISYLSKKGSNINKRKQFTKEVVANRSNIHYRW